MKRLLAFFALPVLALTQTITPALPTAQAGQTITLTASTSSGWCTATGSIGTLQVSGVTVPTCPTLSSSSLTAQYTAPTTGMVSRNTIGGCMVLPMDSIFNTRVDSLPATANSATILGNINVQTNQALNLTGFADFNVIDNTTPTVFMHFYYPGPLNGQNDGNYQILMPPGRKREGGTTGHQDDIIDHHLVSVNHQTCQIYETYQDWYPQGVTPGNVDAASGVTYASTNYAFPAHGTTDAANLPLEPLVPHLSELRQGHIDHMMRMTWCTACTSSSQAWPADGSAGGGNPALVPPMGTVIRLKSSFSISGISGWDNLFGGTGYTTAPTVTVTGCTTPPNLTANISGGAVTGLNIVDRGAGCSTSPTVGFSGGGGSGANFLVYSYSTYTRVILDAAQKHGFIVADNGGNAQLTNSSDFSLDTAANGINTSLNHTRPSSSPNGQGMNIFDNFEIVDMTGVKVGSFSYQVAPTSAEAGTFAVITAGTTTFPIALQPVTVGFQDETVAIQAGSTPHTSTVYVNGASVNSGVTWSLANCSSVGNCGSIDSSTGVFTPPVTVPASTTVTVQIVATSIQDSAISASQYVTFTQAGFPIRIDTGSSTFTTDTAGNAWSPNMVLEATEGFSTANDTNGGWTGKPDHTIYQTRSYTTFDDLIYGPFYVPNGNYDVTLLFGNAGNPSTGGTCIGSYPWQSGKNFDGPADIDTQGTTVLHGYDYGYPIGYLCYSENTVTFPAKVTDGRMIIGTRGTSPVANNGQNGILINGLTINQDTNPAHWAIDTQSKFQLKPGSVGTWSCGTQFSKTTNTLQYYLQDWFTGVNDPTWSVISGPGTIDTNGCYTLPSSQTVSTHAIIQATDGTYTAQADLLVLGSQSPAFVN